MTGHGGRRQATVQILTGKSTVRQAYIEITEYKLNRVLQHLQRL